MCNGIVFIDERSDLTGGVAAYLKMRAGEPMETPLALSGGKIVSGNFLETKLTPCASSESGSGKTGETPGKTKKSKAGRPSTVSPEERMRNLGICGNAASEDYLRLWRPQYQAFNKKTQEWEWKDDFTGAFGDILDYVKRCRPGGAHSGPCSGVSTQEFKLRPGTKTSLKRELAAARAEIEQLRAALAEAKETA